MAASFTVNGDGTTTVTLAYTALTENVQTTVEAAAHRIYTRQPPTREEDSGEVDGDGNPIMETVPIPWGDLTNQDKLDLVDRFVRWRVVELGREYLHDTRNAERDALREEDNATLMEPE